MSLKITNPHDLGLRIQSWIFLKKRTLNLSHRSIVAKFCIKNRSMVITEQFFGVILKLLACGMFLRGFTVSSYQRPL